MLGLEGELCIACSKNISGKFGKMWGLLMGKILYHQYFSQDFV